MRHRTALMITHATEMFASTVLSHPHCNVSIVFEMPPATCRSNYGEVVEACGRF